LEKKVRVRERDATIKRLEKDRRWPAEREEEREEKERERIE